MKLRPRKFNAATAYMVALPPHTGHTVFRAIIAADLTSALQLALERFPRHGDLQQLAPTLVDVLQSDEVRILMCVDAVVEQVCLVAWTRVAEVFNTEDVPAWEDAPDVTELLAMAAAGAIDEEFHRAWPYPKGKWSAIKSAYTAPHARYTASGQCVGLSQFA